MRIPLHAILISTVLFSSARLAAQAPANDQCINATAISCGQSILGNTAEATNDPTAIACGTDVQAVGIWYRFLGTGDALTLTTCTNTLYDTRINVYAGACNALLCIAGNDDGGNCGTGSTISFAAEAGLTYYILVQGYAGATGEFQMNTTCGPVTSDFCAGGTPIDCFQSLSGSTVGATDDAVPFCETGVQAPGVWYTFTGVEGQVQFSTCESITYDSRINVYSGGCSNLLCVTGNDDTENVGTCSTVGFVADPDLVYHVLVQGYDGEVGDFLLEMACLTCGTPSGVIASASDESAFITWNSLNPGSTYEIEYGLLGFTPGTGTISTGPVNDASASAQIDGLDAATEYAFYLREICGPDDQSATVGVFIFSTLEEPPTENATCSGALPISCGGDLEGNTQGSFYVPGEACGAAFITSRGLWYSFTGTGQTMTLSTCGQADFDTKISVYSGSCADLQCVAGVDDAPGCEANTSSTTFPTVSGTTYYAFVHAYQDGTGTFTLSLTCGTGCAPVPANDVCSGAPLLTVSSVGQCSPSSANNTCAFAAGVPNPPCDPYAPIVDVWYRFETGPYTNFTLLATALSASEVNAALYTDCGSLQYVDCKTEMNAPWHLNNLEPDNTYYVRLWNGGGEEAGSMALCVERDVTTAVATSTLQNGVRSWPNPANDRITIQGLAADIIAVVDPQGRTVLTHHTNGAQQTDLDITSLAPGTYVVRSLDVNGGAIGRFIKQ